ncbi:MAG: hypothetical protein ACKV0T_22980, partial [Planctomycetales bacterium]
PSSPFGQPVRFEVECRGEFPEEGVVRLVSLSDGERAEVRLLPSESPVSEGRWTYIGQLPRLVEPVEWEVRLGDDTTPMERLEVIPLPAVALEMSATPPDYARGRSAPRGSAGARRLAVLEGSVVEMRLNCANKPLRSVSLLVEGARFPMQPDDDGRRAWSLKPTAGPLDPVREPTRFELEVLDDDRLSPGEPVRGVVDIEPDEPPRVAAAVALDVVLPKGAPTISWGVSDDFGLTEVRLTWQLIRQGGEPSEGMQVLWTKLGVSQPLSATLKGRDRLELSRFQLVPGDELKVVVEAVDDRGRRAGMSSASEPIMLQVRDEAGILAALSEADERTLRELDEIIQRELKIGAAP